MKISSLDEPYFSSTLLGARRVKLDGSENLIAQAEERLREYVAHRAQTTVASRAAKNRTHALNTKSGQKTHQKAGSVSGKKNDRNSRSLAKSSPKKSNTKVAANKNSSKAAAKKTAANSAKSLPKTQKGQAASKKTAQKTVSVAQQKKGSKARGRNS